MRVNPNRDLSRVAEVTSAKKPAPSGHGTDSAHTSGTAELKRALNEIPDVRPDKVAQAKALLKEPGYPEDKTLEKVANLLADHLGPKPRV